jgi:hypothetical protein
MKPTSRTLSWAFVIIMLAVGIFTALNNIDAQTTARPARAGRSDRNPY